MLFGDALQLGQDLLDAGRADAGKHAVLLQNLAADVQREVFAVDDAADEAEVGREELFGVVQDEDALDVELDADLVLGLVEVKRRARRNEEERDVLQAALGAGVKPEERIFAVAGEALVELLVVLVG